MAKKYLAESDIEEAAIEWLLQLKPYHYMHGEDIHRNRKKAVLEDRFENFLQQTYKDVPAKVLAEVKQEFLFNAGTDIHQRNHAFHLKLGKGISKAWKENRVTTLEDTPLTPLEGGRENQFPSREGLGVGKEGKQCFQHFYPINYDEPLKNDFLVVNQFTIDGKNRRRPDLIIFINGLPIVLFEFKNLFTQDATVDEAFNQVQHYIEDIPQVFETNALTVLSDGSTTLHGMYSSGMEWYAAWKSTDGINTVTADFALETLIKGLLVPERLLQYIRFYIFHELDKGKLVKKGAKYHQYFGIQYALAETKKSIRPVGDGRIGVIWHTTRSGKSITMAIYTGILRQMPELKNPTIIVQVDRFDLSKQLYEDFIAAKDLVGDIALAEDTDDLRKLLSGEGGGVIFSTIEKFRLKKLPYQELPSPNPSQEGNNYVVGNSSLEGGKEGVTPGKGGIKGGVKKLIADGKAGINTSAFTRFGVLQYNPNVKIIAHDLRYAGNLPEVLLWNQLKRDSLGVDFHRQKAIGNYVVDLFCPELMLAIEIDGKGHNDAEAVQYDEYRQEKLEDCGIRFLRFSAKEVFQEISVVVERISEYVKENKIDEKLSQLERGVYNKNKQYFDTSLGLLKEGMDTPLALLEGGLNTPLTPLEGGTTSNSNSGHVDILANVNKFPSREGLGVGIKEIEHPVLSTRENIIVIADECHRTQYGLIQGFARNLRKAVPNASFIGFTGTPVDSKDADTVSVFGEIIHTYDIKQATEDHAVVPIYYEPRLAKLHLGNAQIEEEAEEITAGLNDNDRNKVMWAAMEDAAGSAERVDAISRDILTHYLNRTSNLEGKAMIVCMSRRNCVKMYDAITALEGCPEVAVIMTSNIAKDPVEWNRHIRTKDAMEAVKARFKDADDPLKIVIVRDMWLTGFDNPSLHTLYVDKIMNNQNLIQAVNRVATVFKDKPSGLIVDYIGIGDRLRDATKKYTAGGGKGGVTIDISEAIEMAKEEVSLLKTFLPPGFDYSSWLSLSKGDRLKVVQNGVNYIVSDDQQCNAFLLSEKRLSSIVPVIKSEQTVEDISLDIIFFQHLGSAVRKVKFPPTPLRKKEQQIKDLIHRSIESEDVIDVFEMAGIDRFDISIINDDFLATAKERKSGNELKLELIRQILEDEIKLRSFKNIVKSKKLKEEVDKIISDYHNHFFDTLIALQKLRNVAGEYQDEDVRRRQLGLTEEEEAFYEILAHHKNAIQDFELMKELVKEITVVVKKNLKVDWYKKQDLVAMIKKSVRLTLMKRGVMQELQEILDEIMEQVNARYREWEAA